MTAYIIRRLVLMIPTLLGMTVMVFLIARLAPGRPGATQHEATQMSAEAQTAIREWYEKRYGLDGPLWRQYLRWWRGMILVDAQAAAWTDEPAPRPVYTLRRSAPHYLQGISNSPPTEQLPVLLVRGKDNRWLRLVQPSPTASPKVRILKQSDEQLSRRLDDHAGGFLWKKSRMGVSYGTRCYPANLFPWIRRSPSGRSDATDMTLSYSS